MFNLNDLRVKRGEKGRFCGGCTEMIMNLTQAMKDSESVTVISVIRTNVRLTLPALKVSK